EKAASAAECGVRGGFAMNQYGIGQPVRRVEDRRFLTGHGRYVDDLNLPGQVRAYMLRSPHAHAHVRRIDTAAAAAAPGVLTVLTGEDLARDGRGPSPCPSALQAGAGSRAVAPPRRACGRARVGHAGDTVALVAAESTAGARDAAELVEILYEPLPAAVETTHALDPGQPVVWDA